MTVRATDGSETLLKHALPVPDGSAEPKARLTRRQVPLAVRQLRDFNSRARGAAVTALDSTPRSQLINYLIIFFSGGLELVILVIPVISESCSVRSRNEQDSGRFLSLTEELLEMTGMTRMTSSSPPEKKINN